LSVLLSLLVPAQATRSPDCAGILTPVGLSYGESGPPVPAGGGAPAARNQINSVTVAELSLSLIPDSGLRLSIDVDLGITPTPSTTKVMRLSILADLHVEMNPEGNLELVTSACKPTVKETMGTPAPEAFGGRLVSADPRLHLPPLFLFFIPQICLEISKLLLLPNEELMSLTAQFPVTPSCQVQYLPLAAPVFSKQGITVSLRTTFQVAGIALPLPVSPVPFSVPESASSGPAHLALVFSKHFYTSLFFALEIAGAFNMTIPSPLTTATMAQRISQMGALFQDDLSVTLQVVFRSSPWVALEEGEAALKLFLTVHVGEGSPTFQSFLSINVDMAARLLLSVADTRMIISVSETEDVEFSLAASSVGPVPAAVLQELFLPTIREEVLVQMNEVLSEGVFLPHTSSFTYTDVNVLIHK
ncbi:TENP protein, partial [Corythaeola cristata]|nr:TENP protein [Corythaeola cristata]